MAEKTPKKSLNPAIVNALSKSTENSVSNKPAHVYEVSIYLSDFDIGILYLILYLIFNPS